MTPAAIPSPAGRERFRSFLAFLAQRTRDEPEEPALLSEAAERLRVLLSSDDWLPDEFAQAHADRYQQYLLYCDPQRRFSVVSFVWGPGQRTPIHDHLTWGLVGVLRGAEVCENFEWREGRLVSLGPVTLRAGDVALLSPSRGDIHRVRNAFPDRVSVSVHVYGDDIGAVERHLYGEDGREKPFVSAYANATLPNLWGRP